MATAEVARLARRVDNLDETLRAIGDTTLETKETVDRHTVQLAALETRLERVEGTLGEHGEMLGEILRRLPA